MRVALLPGHAARSEGAVVCAGYFEGFGEYALAAHYLPAVECCLGDLGHEVVLTRREAAGGVSPVFSARAANAAGADVALEWHFNSAGPGARGCEVLFWGASATGRRFAEGLSARIARILGVPDRGAKAVSRSGDRGFRAFRDSRMPFFMVEPCFAGCNAEEARVFGASIVHGVWPVKVARAVHEVIEEVYNGKDN